MKTTDNQVAELFLKAAKLSTEAATLASKGQLDRALQVENEADVLRRRAKARARRAVATAAGATQGERRETGREVTISALNELGVPSSPKAVAEYALARFAKMIDYRALASLRRDEMRAWGSTRTQRPVYVVPALEGRRFLPLRGKVTLSEWPLDRRVVGPWSERVDHLKATLNVASHCAWVAGQGGEYGAPLLNLLQSYALTIPGAVDRDDVAPADPERVRRAARAELDVLEPEDADWRQKAAERAKELSERDRLWGSEPPSLVEIR